MKHVFIAALSLFMIGGVLPASASTIYIQDSGTGLLAEAMGGGDLTRWGFDYPWSVGWSQTGTYTNVSISADVNITGSPGDPPVKPTDTGHSFLTTQVGAGTTVANQIASGTFAGTSDWASNPHPNWITLFTGLTLGPGTYYLTLDTTGYGGGWRVDTTRGQIDSHYKSVLSDGLRSGQRRSARPTTNVEHFRASLQIQITYGALAD
jgi:hypothetical protein